MNGVFHIGATGLATQQRALNITANNIANINTPGFKRSSISFSEMLSQSPTPAAVQGVESQGGVWASATRPDFAQGELRSTENELDLAIQGGGFVEVIGEAGRPMIWRGGSLKVNPDGFLATESGLALRDMIGVPEDATQLRIDRDGEVSVLVGEEWRDIGQISMVMVKDMDAVAPIGSGLYEVENPAALIDGSAAENGRGVFVQGSIEQSNVQLSDEMVSLLLMQRSYAANAQVVQAGDQLMAIANGLRR